MKLHLPSQSGVTVVENIFIDQYMPKANGEFVKLYLYLLRCAAAGKELSLSSIADVFDHTEGDVKRALAYWEKLHLLKLQYDGGGNCATSFFWTAIQTGKPPLPPKPVRHREQRFLSLFRKSLLFPGSGKKRWQARRRSAS